MAVRKKWDLGFDASRVLRRAYVMLFLGGRIAVDPVYSGLNSAVSSSASPWTCNTGLISLFTSTHLDLIQAMI